MFYNYLYQIQQTNQQKYISEYYDKFCLRYKLDEINPEKQYGRSKITFSMYLAQKCIIPPEQFLHNPQLQDSVGNTVQYYLQSNKINVPKIWQIQDDSNTQFLEKSINTQNQDLNIIDLQQNEQQNQLNNENNQEIKQYLSQYCKEYNIDEQTIINNPEWQDNNDKYTFAMYLANYKEMIPQSQYNHNPLLQSQYGNTVAVYLELNGIDTPRQWQYSSEYRFIDDNTTAMLIAQKGVIPSECWHHNPQIKNNKGKTVKDYFEDNNMEVPIQWSIDIQIELDQEIKDQLQQYCQNQQIDDINIIFINPEYQKYYGCNTFAMWLAQKGIIPPKQFEHKADIINDDNCTVALLLASNKIIPPIQWNHNPLLKNRKKYTVSMLLAKQGIIPPQQWQHKTYLQDIDKYTVAMHLSFNSIVPLEQWYHNPQAKNKWGKTVENYLNQNNIEVPNYWKVKEMSKDMKKYLQSYCNKYKVDNQIIIDNPEWRNNLNKQTFAMYLQNMKINPPREFEHDPIVQDIFNNTMAVYLERNNIKTPQQWQYNPNYILNNGFTTAMKIAQIGIIPSEQWNHNPILSDNINNSTVALLLAQKGIVPPKQWFHDCRISDKNNKTVQDYLRQNHVEVTKQWHY